MENQYLVKATFLSVRRRTFNLDPILIKIKISFQIERPTFRDQFPIESATWRAPGCLPTSKQAAWKVLSFNLQSGKLPATS